MIVKTYCSLHQRPFGIVFRKKNFFEWEGISSLAAPENRNIVGYGPDIISGGISTSNAYPGCPYCASKGIFLCNGCNTLHCFGQSHDRPNGTWATCVNCGDVGPMTGAIQSLDAYSDYGAS